MDLFKAHESVDPKAVVLFWVLCPITVPMAMLAIALFVAYFVVTKYVPIFF